MRTDSKLLLATLLALLLGMVLSLEVMDLRGEEPRRGLVSLEMYLSGNWLQPQLLNTPYYNKPPLLIGSLGFFFGLTMVLLICWFVYLHWRPGAFWFGGTIA